MVTVSHVKLAYGERVLFKDVNLRFVPGNCYGLIGANGSGKSTFLKILTGEIEQDEGVVVMPGHQRVASLAQDTFAFDDYKVIDAAMAGHKELYALIKEREVLYAKEEFSDEDGYRVTELEERFAEIGGWQAEGEVSTMLTDLGIEQELFEREMKHLENDQKFRVLLVQALFGNPDVLLLDEPTNHLDMESIAWLGEILCRFPNVVIVVSHDRHFLNKVCTHVVDIDYGKMQVYVGNYSFWQQMSALIARQNRDRLKRDEDKAKELKAFIQRFSANAAKSKQATSRKKELGKLEARECPSSCRRSPYVAFQPEREPGRVVLDVHGLSKEMEGELLFKNLDLTIGAKEKVAFVGPNNQAKTTFMEIVSRQSDPDEGTSQWGITTKHVFCPKDNSDYFQSPVTMLEWLTRYSEDKDMTFVRGVLGRVLFSGEETLKKVTVLSGGERVRCMLAKLMISGANVLLFDDPTAHLDLEAITALNDGLVAFPGVVLFSSHDYEFTNTIANRIIEFTPEGIIDWRGTFEDYLKSSRVTTMRDRAYDGHHKRLIL